MMYVFGPILKITIALDIAYIVSSTGIAAMFVGQTIFLADIVDYGEYKNGERNESITFSKNGFLQKIVKIDTEKENANTVAKRELNENAKVNDTFSFEIVEKYDSYTRAGEVISVDGVKYAIESTSHSYKDGWHFDKLELSKLE